MIDLDSYRRDRAIKSSTFSQYKWCLRSLEKHLRRPAEPGDFNRDTLNGYLLALERTHSDGTVRSRRCTLTAIWSWLAETGQAGPPQKLRQRKQRWEPPQSVPTTEEAATIIRRLSRMPGTIRGSGGLRQADFWVAWCRVAYESALRPCDQFLLESEAVFSASGRITICQEKTLHPVRIQLSTETVDACRPLVSPHRRYLFPRFWRREHFSRAMRRVTKACGLELRPKDWRRIAATAAESRRPGTSWRLLGHRSPDLSAKHYYDHEAVVYDLPRLTSR